MVQEKLILKYAAYYTAWNKYLYDLVDFELKG